MAGVGAVSLTCMIDINIDSLCVQARKQARPYKCYVAA